MGFFIEKMAKLTGELIKIERTKTQEQKLDENTRKQVESVKEQAQNGNLAAMTKLAYFHCMGQYVQYDPELARDLWEAAAQKGYIEAQYNLGVLYMGDVSTLVYDEAKAAYWLERAANKGSNEAQNMLQTYFEYDPRTARWKKRR